MLNFAKRREEGESEDGDGEKGKYGDMRLYQNNEDYFLF